MAIDLPESQALASTVGGTLDCSIDHCPISSDAGRRARLALPSPGQHDSSGQPSLAGKAGRAVTTLLLTESRHVGMQMSWKARRPWNAILGVIVTIWLMGGGVTADGGGRATTNPQDLTSNEVVVARISETLGMKPSPTVGRQETETGGLPDGDYADVDMRALADRIAAVEQQLAATAGDPTSGKLTIAPALAHSSPEASEIPPDKWSVKLGGHIQTDYITWADRDPALVGAENYFSFRRLRLLANGEGYGQFDFRLQITLEPGRGSHESAVASPDVKDAYVSMNDIPLLGRLRVGNFFVPFSLEQVTNDTNNIFSERSIPSQGIFAVDREVGIALYNCSENERVTWTGGLFFDNLNDTFKTRFDANQGLRLSGRLTWLPYYDKASNGRYLIHTGLGVLHTHDHDDRVRFAATPGIQRGPFIIDTGNLEADRYTTGNAELAIVAGSITWQNEAFLSNVESLTGNDLHVGGAYSHLSWFLTGENRIFVPFGQHGPQFGRNRPNNPLRLTASERAWGAIEAKTRWSFLDLTDAGAGQYNELTVGFNWYWSDRTRVMFDWIHPLTSAETVFGTTESDLLAMRFDVNW